LRETKDFRARNVVEQGDPALLMAAASIAILTTLGIVLSLVFNTIEFFRLYPAGLLLRHDLGAELLGPGRLVRAGIIPLLWGTFYISIVALAVAVPIGLFAAIYLSEYASPKVRAFAKPLLEILAGIPTIVYGLFALLTVGPCW
jgi:phosphate transport system permease protein